MTRPMTDRDKVERRNSVIKRAAEILREEAECLKRSHAYVDGTWDLKFAIDRRAKAEHDEMLQVADDLDGTDDASIVADAKRYRWLMNQLAKRPSPPLAWILYSSNVSADIDGHIADEQRPCAAMSVEKEGGAG